MSLARTSADPYGPTEPAIEALRERFGERFSTVQAVRDQHSHSVNWIKPMVPEAVVFPRTTQEVQAIVAICRDACVPIVPFGAGSSLEGHVNAAFGGVTVSTREMTDIVEVNATDLDAVVQPGVSRLTLNKALRETGLFFPIDPGADASLGGMAATRASGTNAVRYGTMKDVVLGLTAVLADGSIVKAGGRARKSSAGYDLTRLMIGSEGTLGIITELRVKLSGIPEAVLGGICPFPSVRAACEAAIATIQSGVPIARVELLDAAAVRASNLYSKMTLPETPMLFVEFHGTPTGAREQAELFAGLAEECGGGPFQGSTDADERARLWQARHDAHWASFTLRPGATNLATDVCLPLSRLADCVAETADDLRASGILATMIGHVGDGNFHVAPLFDRNSETEVRAVKGFVDRLVERALAMGGTSTGEHGVGQEKRRYMAAEHGEPALAVMRAIKHALDPQGIMNPGKIL